MNTNLGKDDPIWFCQVCGIDTSNDDKDYYMVKDEIWEEHAENKAGMMCMGCIEEKLGHQLTRDDVTDCPLNRYLNPVLAKLF